MDFLNEFNSITDLTKLQNLSDETVANINGSRILQLLLNKIVKIVVGGKSAEVNNLLNDNINFVFNEVSVMDADNNVIISRIPAIAYIQDYLGEEVTRANEETGELSAKRYKNYADYNLSATGMLLSNNIKNKYVEYFDAGPTTPRAFDSTALQSRRPHIELYSDWQNSYYREYYDTCNQLRVDYKFNRATKAGYYSQYYSTGGLYFSIKCDLIGGLGLFTIYDETSRKKIVEVNTAPYVGQFVF